MKVEMLCNTYYGVPRKPGDILDVDDKTGDRWIQAGIARQSEPAEKPLGKMTTAELTEKAAGLGVDISAATNNDQRAEAIKAFLASGEETAKAAGQG